MDVLTTLPPKKTVLKALLNAGSVFLHIDPRVKGVAVPDYLVAQPSVVLQIGYKLARPIPDLKLSEKGVTATLSFSNIPYHCRMPWNSVFAMVAENGRVMLWPSDMPAELLEDADEDPDTVPDSDLQADAGDREEGDQHARPGRATMRVIQGGLAHSTGTNDDEPTDDGPTRKRPDLHLVN